MSELTDAISHLAESLGTAQRRVSELEEAARRVWDTIPGEYGDDAPGAKEHAAALCRLRDLVYPKTEEADDA